MMNGISEKGKVDLVNILQRIFGIARSFKTVELEEKYPHDSELQKWYSVYGPCGKSFSARSMGKILRALVGEEIDGWQIQLARASSKGHQWVIVSGRL